MAFSIHAFKLLCQAASQSHAVPQSTSLPTIAGIATVDQLLEGTDGTYSNGPITNIDYQWQRLDQSGDYLDIEGAIDADYTLRPIDQSTYVRRGERPSNANAPGAWYYSDPVGPIASRFTVSGAPILTGTVGVAQEFELTIVGGRAPYSITSTGDELFDGLTVAGFGFSGTPTEAGAINVQFTVEDADGLVQVFNASYSVAAGIVKKIVMTGGGQLAVPSDYISTLGITLIGPGGDGSYSGPTDTRGGHGGGSGAIVWLDGDGLDIEAGTSLEIRLPAGGAQLTAYVKDNSGTIIAEADYGRNAGTVSGGTGGQASASIGTIKRSGSTGGTGFTGAGNKPGGGGAGCPSLDADGEAGGNASSSLSGKGGNSGDGRQGGARVGNNTDAVPGEEGTSFDPQVGPGAGAGGGGGNKVGGKGGNNGAGGSGGGAGGTGGRYPGKGGSAAVKFEYYATGDSNVEVSSITQYGVTFVFSEPRPVKQYANGDWAVQSPVTITQITPDSTSIEVTTHASGPYTRWMNGTMINPGNRSYTGGSTSANREGVNQGHDSYKAVDSQYQRYTHAYNVDPGATDQPIVFAEGEEGSVVKAVSALNPDAYGRGTTLSDMVVLTVVAELPADNAIRPGIAGSDKTSRFTTADIDLGVFQSLSDPAQNKVSYATAKANLRRLQYLGWTTLLNSQNMYAYNNSKSYGQDLAWDNSEVLLSLHLGYTDAEKLVLAAQVLTYAEDLYRRAEEGGQYPAKAFNMGGGDHGRKPVLVMAACMTQDPALLEWSDFAQHPTVFQDDRQYMVVDEYAVSLPGYLYTSGSQRRAYDAYELSHIGMEDWQTQWGAGGEGSNTQKAGSNYSVSYRNIVGASNMGNMLAVKLTTGGRAAWNNEVVFRYYERYWNHLRFNNRWQGTNGMKGWDYYMMLAHNPVEYPSGTPTRQSITVKENRLWIRYDRLLDDNEPPAPSDFAITVNGSPRNVVMVGRYGIYTYQAIGEYRRLPMGYCVELELESAVAAGQTVVASYTQGTDKIRDLNGNLAASFSSQAVTNIT